MTWEWGSCTDFWAFPRHLGQDPGAWAGLGALDSAIINYLNTFFRAPAGQDSCCLAHSGQNRPFLAQNQNLSGAHGFGPKSQILVRIRGSGPDPGSRAGPRK